MYNVRIPRAQEIFGRRSQGAYGGTSGVRNVFPGVPPAEIPRARLFAAPIPYSTPERVPTPSCIPSRRKPARPGSPKTFSLLPSTWTAVSESNLCRRGPGRRPGGVSEHTCFQGAPLEEVKSLVAGAAIFIGNDSGTGSHRRRIRTPRSLCCGARRIWKTGAPGAPRTRC